MKNIGLEDTGIIKPLLDRLDIYKHIFANPRQLSTGERQRVALASVLVAEPQVLLIDEPMRGLDYDTKKKLGELLTCMVKNEKRTIYN